MVISAYLIIQNWSIIAESLEVIMMASPKASTFTNWCSV